MAHSPGNIPARRIYELNLVPIHNSIVHALANLIETERFADATFERKLLLANFADFRSAYLQSITILEKLIQGTITRLARIFKSRFQRT
ncbi:MAG: hypothetical protein O3C63_07000 [Cyanobacteria bacterium]|nr:hypothetical protein [Cyanobacteriota bacterium]